MVAQSCERFASRAFANIGNSARDWPVLADLVGKWHDLGKFSDDFQDYLLKAGGALADAHQSEIRGKVDHSTAGAQHAVNVLKPPLGHLLAYPIAGHHSGLLDHNTGQTGCLRARLSKKTPGWQHNVPESLLNCGSVAFPKLNGENLAEIALRYAFAARVLFSCLVDADFLATEAFMNSEQSAMRPALNVSFAKLDDFVTGQLDHCFDDADNEVARARADVLAACRGAAPGAPGFYSLTVPTGGGKTLSSLAFALRHAAKNKQQRVIYAIPFTSIIEQNARVFCGILEGFGIGVDDLILEHHSNFDLDSETTRSRLASENWDAPIVVTTNVQLFESLFANRTSRCRKLHRVANSVIVLDEVQTLPIELLTPCLSALKILVKDYGCTVVLCSATQPAIEYRHGEFEQGISDVTPIIDDAPALYHRLKRVSVGDAGRLDCAQLAQRLRSENQVLAIVNTRKHAAELFAAVSEYVDEGCFHLSAAMTPEHRSERLSKIRSRLHSGQSCRVVSTQLIEAGVDVDFPVVYRSLSGLDSIAQAAGRCNREGRRTCGHTWVFCPDPNEHPIPRGFLGRAANTALEVMDLGKYPDLLSLDAIRHYFQLHYWQHKDEMDKHDILDGFCLNGADNAQPFVFNYASVAESFRFINTPQRPVIIPRCEQSRSLVEKLRQTDRLGLWPPRDVTRRLQRFSVGVRQRDWQQALGQELELLHGQYAVLTTVELNYSNELGLQLDAEPLYDPNLLCGV